MDYNDSVSVFVIGDPHFQFKSFQECEELIEKCVDAVSKIKPDIIVLLGDVLDTHEIAKTSPWKQACRFIENLSEYAPTYVLMGNHDLINKSQFLTDNHFFGPLKKWKNVYIVDYPIHVEYDNKNFVMCPYVPPGRFVEALELTKSENPEFTWDKADCIFGHQEIEGCEYNGKISEKGDQWDESFPPLILGHIHEPGQIGNVFYPGSSRQVASNESPDKRVWNVTFENLERDDIDNSYGMSIDKIDLCLKAKKEIEIDCSEIKDFDWAPYVERYYIKIKLRGTSEQFKLFRKSPLHAQMKGEGITFGFDVITEEKRILLDRDNNSVAGFDLILKELVESKDANVKNAYEKITGETIIKYELNFIEDDEEE